MFLSYDYSEMIDELREEIEDGILTLSDKINIVRSEDPVFENYYPIIDWYYYPLERALDSIEDDPKAKALFRKDKSFFESALLSDVLAEMEEWNSII